MKQRIWPVLCFSIPAFVLMGAFTWLAVDRSTVNLWNVVVHESGRYTLGQTVLYFSHFLREIPTIVAMSLFVVAVHAPPHEGTRASPAPKTWALGALAAATGLIVMSLLVVIREQGAAEAVRNITQLYTRDDLPLYGSHWRFHLLSTIWFGLASVVLAWAGWRWLGGPSPAPSGSRAPVVAWAYFLILTVVFGLGLSPFVDPRYLGHQAREILTHGTVTLPLGLGLMSMMYRGARATADVRPPRAVVLFGVFVIPLFLAIAVLASDAMATGQSGQGMVAMVATHYFEHTLDYILFGLLVVGVAPFGSVLTPAMPHAHA